MALINTPPDVCQSKLEITVFVLVGAMGYSNSAINPILYAFLRYVCCRVHDTVVTLVNLHIYDKATQ